MARKKDIDLDSYVSEAKENITADRKKARETLDGLLLAIGGGVNKDRVSDYTGAHNSAAKLLETMQRSNEQLVKLIGLIYKEKARKEEGDDFDLSDDDAGSIYSEIKGK